MIRCILCLIDETYPINVLCVSLRHTIEVVRVLRVDLSDYQILLFDYLETHEASLGMTHLRSFVSYSIGGMVDIATHRLGIDTLDHFLA